MFRSIGFIGTGHMGSALARVAAKGAAGAPVYLANRTQEKARRLAQELDCRVADNETIAQHCDLIFLGVKPQLMGQVLGSLSRSWLPVRTGLFWRLWPLVCLLRRFRRWRGRNIL